MNTKPMQLVGRDHPALHSTADEVTEIDSTLWDLVLRMRQTLITMRGEALAAPQVGRPLAVVVTAHGDVLVNPHCEGHGRKVSDLERCLSIPGRVYEVERFEKATLEAINLAGEPIVIGINGFEARLWQHEIDHLDGVLISERWPEVRQPKAG